MAKKYIDANKLKTEIKRLTNQKKEKLKRFSDEDYTCSVASSINCKLQGNEEVLSLIDSLQQEQPKLYKDESLGSPDYERGFKHGRDYQTEVTRKYTNKDKVIAYLVDKGYPVSTNGEIPTYQEIFDMINNAIKHANKQEQPEYGYITTEYIPGKKPRWKVGDILAYYINNSDEEGEAVLGKVVNIEPDEDRGWLYTFENEDVWDEESLITEGTYEK